jgi:hypothetical protein
MDFNKLLSKLKSIDPTDAFDPKGVSAAATEANKPAPKVKLDEAAQLRVLSGRSTMLAESVLAEKKLTAAEKDKKEEVVKGMKGDKKGFMKRYGKEGEEVMHATATKVAKKKVESVEALDTEEEIDEVFDAGAKVGDKKKTSSGVATKTATGLKHEKTYAKDADGDDAPKAKKKVKEELKVGDTKKSSTGGTIEKTKTGLKHTAGKNYGGKTAEDEAKSKKVKESAKPDFLDIDGDGDKKEPMKKAAADKKKGAAPKKGVNPFAKKAVKESIERQDRLTFVECLQAVKESQGSLQIDPMDKALWTWAQRVSSAKVGNGFKADAYAAKVYESYGGEWSLYNTLTEDQ